jgi:hypothetical protein
MGGKNAIIDDSLNPQNASSKGYSYINDVPNLLKTVTDLFEEAAKSGYKMGKAKNSRQKIGLYRAIK